jgi:membrane-associated progesterone receptor component
MSKNGGIQVDLEGKTINVPADGYSIGLFSFSDLWKVIMNDENGGSLVVQVEQLFLKFRSGDPRTLMMIGISFCVSSWFLYLIYFQLFGNSGKSDSDSDAEKEKEEEPIVLRDFTAQQLREFDGEHDSKPPYIALCGDVYDVSGASDFYGKGGPYHCFSGRDASRAMAKFSLDEANLASSDISDLGPFERSQLQDWVMKFKHYKCYPIIGKLSTAPQPRPFTRAELVEYNGQQSIPDGRIHAPIYVAIKGKVFDVSFGGQEFYGKDGPYALFAGRDVSKALAKMSFLPEDLNNYDLSDLDEKQQKTLNDWAEKFENVKKYPIVGHLVE